MTGGAAFVDESCRGTSYLLCAVLVPAARLHPVRRAMRGLCLRGQRNMHMREESASRKRLIVSTLCDLGVRTRISISQGPQREARANAMSKLASDVALDQINRLVIESRPGRDVEDRNVLFALTRKQNLGQLSYEHQRPWEEPLLWIPDAVAWAYGAGGDWRRRVAPIIDKVL